MPIRPEHRFFYPIDWPQLSDAIRFRRARGRCEKCARPHLQQVFHLGDGRKRSVTLPFTHIHCQALSVAGSASSVFG